jgi:hypothetical protein
VDRHSDVERTAKPGTHLHLTLPEFSFHLSNTEAAQGMVVGVVGAEEEVDHLDLEGHLEGYLDLEGHLEGYLDQEDYQVLVGQEEIRICILDIHVYQTLLYPKLHLLGR